MRGVRSAGRGVEGRCAGCGGGRGVEDRCAGCGGGRVSTLTYALLFVLEPAEGLCERRGRGEEELGVVHTYQILTLRGDMSGSFAKDSRSCGEKEDG